MISSVTLFGISKDTMESQDFSAAELAELTSGRQLTDAGCADWAITAIDTFNNVGLSPSAHVDDNNVVHVSYFDLSSDSLKYAEITNGGAQYSVQLVDSEPNMVMGNTNDIVADMYVERILYTADNMTDSNNSELRLATSFNNGPWSIEVIDTRNSNDWDLAIDMDLNGDLHFAYSKNGKLWYGFQTIGQNNQPVNSFWNLSMMSNVGTGVNGIDITVDNQIPAAIISFSDMSYDLKVATGIQDPANPNAALAMFDVVVVDSPPQGSYIGMDTDIELTSTGPKVMYTDFSNDIVKYAMTDASGQWSYSTIFTGRHGLSMAMDSTESPHMTWHVNGVDEIRYAQFDSSGASIDAVLDYSGAIHIENELDSMDVPHVVYYGGNSDLMYATCDDSTNNGGNPPQSGGPCDIDVTPGLVWDANTQVSTGDVYEYPAGSGEYHVVVIQGYVDQIVGAPGVDLDVWSKNPCKCEDIWIDSGMPGYDANVQYLPGDVVEYPVGTGDVWMAIMPAAIAGVAPDQPWADGNDWEQCTGVPTSGGPCDSFNGQVGPAWDYYVNVSTNDVFEYPANSGVFYQMWQPNIDNLTISVTPEDVNAYKYWSEPCTCEEIWDAFPGGEWSPNNLYTGNAMVEWPSGSQVIWYNNEMGGFGTTPVTTGEPGVDQHWIECKTDDMSTGPCTQFDGSVGDQVWSPNSVVTVGEVYEYPANSGLYYYAHHVDPNGMVTVAPDEAQAYEFWSRDCTCEEIWFDAGMPVWDASVPYDTGMVVEYPPNTGDLWIASDNTQVADAPGNSSPQVWNKCMSESQSNPCAGFDALGIEFMGTWDPSILVEFGQVYEYPAGDGIYYEIVIPFTAPTSVGAPGLDLDAWAPIACPCKDTWMANGQPVWDDTMPDYPGNYVVEWPIGSMNLWITEGGGLAVNVEPGIDPHWMPCEEQPPEGGPCAGLDVVGVWDPNTLVEFGQVYEYPAGLGMYYEIVIPFNVPTNVGAPGVDLDAWAPIACPCKDTWMVNGQPVWDPNNNGYPGNYVVEWPAGSQELYISEGGGLTASAGEPGIDSHWMPCKEKPPQEGSGCEGLDVLGVWDSSILVNYGQVYEYPAQSGMFYEVLIAFMQPTQVGAPGVDLDAWGIINCPCKETWEINGQPVWDPNNNGYTGNYVVEWPANSGVLYISEGGGLTSGAGEPGIDGHWIPCDTNPSDIGPCAGFSNMYSGVWDPTVAVTTGEIYEYPAQSGIYYEVVIQGYNGQTTNSPVIDLDVWSLKQCPCSETWTANGEPVWDASAAAYPGNYVVEWPANSGVLYISEGGGIGNVEPGTDGHWIPCEDLKISNADNVDSNDKEEEDDDERVPAIGIVGTMVAVTIGFMVARKDL